MRAGRALRDQWADERFARDNPGVSPTIRHPLTCPPCGTEAKVGTRAVRFTATGETVSSAAYVDSGVTTSSKSVATPLTTCTVNKTGYTTVTVTLSTGRTRERRVYFISPHGGLGATDYR